MGDKNAGRSGIYLPRKKPMQREKAIELTIRKVLESQGWLVEKTHGNEYQAGWPDLWCYHVVHGARWIEVKRLSGKLTLAQRKKFKAWLDVGVGIWILTSKEEISLIHGPQNAQEWL